jgi:hypothetical protein
VRNRISSYLLNIFFRPLGYFLAKEGGFWKYPSSSFWAEDEKTLSRGFTYLSLTIPLPVPEKCISGLFFCASSKICFSAEYFGGGAGCIQFVILQHFWLSSGGLRLKELFMQP